MILYKLSRAFFFHSQFLFLKDDLSRYCPAVRSSRGPAVKDNPDRLFSWVFKFYGADQIALHRLHGMKSAKAARE